MTCTKILLFLKEEELGRSGRYEPCLFTLVKGNNFKDEIRYINTDSFKIWIWTLIIILLSMSIKDGKYLTCIFFFFLPSYITIWPYTWPATICTGIRPMTIWAYNYYVYENYGLIYTKPVIIWSDIGPMTIRADINSVTKRVDNPDWY